MDRMNRMGRGPVPVQVGDELDVTIEAVGEKGDGIAKKNGFVLFIPGVKEGQHVRIRVTKVLRKVGFAEVIGEGSAPAQTEEAPEEAQEEPQAEEYEQPAEDSESFGEEPAEEQSEEQSEEPEEEQSEEQSEEPEEELVEEQSEEPEESEDETEKQ